MTTKGIKIPDDKLVKCSKCRRKIITHGVDCNGKRYHFTCYNIVR